MHVKKNRYIALLGVLLLFSGYVWESGQYKDKTYAKQKEVRLSRRRAKNPDEETIRTDLLYLDDEELEKMGNLYSGLVLENERERETNKKGGNDEKVAYLTFDDGPSEVTEKVLDTLKEYGVKATFFVVGNEIRAGREAYLKRMTKEGHAIGIHTFSHKYKEIYCSAEAYVEDVIKTGERIKEVCGVESGIYRFPWGSANCYVKGIFNQVTKELDSLNMEFHDWNVSAEDSVGSPTAYSIKRNVEKDFKRYSQPVILMHDAGTNEMTAKLLPDIIEMIREEGYRFDILPNRKQPYQYLKR